MSDLVFVYSKHTGRKIAEPVPANFVELFPDALARVPSDRPDETPDSDQSNDQAEADSPADHEKEN